MSIKCLPEYLLFASQPSTSTGRGLRPKSRGLVDTWVEGCISLIPFLQAGNREFVEGVDTYSQTITKEEKESGAKKRKHIEITIGPSIYTLYFFGRSNWLQWRGAV
jgi:hypothetical protein